MIEIVAGIYVGSFLLTWAVALHFFFKKLKFQYESRSYKTLKQNLQKVGLTWSNKNSDFISINEEHESLEKKSAYQTFFLITTLCSLLSFIGLLLFTLVALLGRSRKERLVFSSRLVDEDLDSNQVQALVSEIKNSY